MCIQIADMGISAIFLEWLIILRGNFRDIMGGMFSWPKGQTYLLLLLLMQLLLPLLLIIIYYYCYYCFNLLTGLTYRILSAIRGKCLYQHSLDGCQLVHQSCVPLSQWLSGFLQFTLRVRVSLTLIYKSCV